MQSHGLYNLSVQSTGRATRTPRVGLLHGRTGIPVFLLYLEGVNAPRKVELHSSDQLSSEIMRASEADRRAWQMLQPFFEAQGSFAHVVVLPLSKKDRLGSMLGADRGLAERSGIHILKEMVEFADLVVVPQASEWLDGDEHRGFYQSLFDLAERLETIFILVDFPKAMTRDRVEAWLRTTTCVNAAAYYPWILMGNDAFPPGPVIAAAIQLSDATVGIQELPANRSLKGNLVPLLNQTPAQVKDCLGRRINCLVSFSGSDLRVWGGSTLADSLDFNSRLISLHRTAVALKEAIHRVCEPFVLDPALDDLAVFIDTALQNFLRSVKHIFDGDAAQPFSTEVALVTGKSEDVIQVGVKYTLPHAIDQLSLTLGLKT